MAQEKYKKIDEWKSSLENLRVQLHLGLEEAKDEFEEQKKKLNEWTHDIQAKLRHAKDLTEEKALKLRTGLDDLRVQAALGKADTEDAWDKQRDNLSKKIHELKHQVKEVYSHSKGNAKEILDKASDQLDDLHTRFDLFRLQAHLAKMESADAWEERKKVLSEKIHDINTKLEKGKETASEKWDHFSQEMSEAWTHFRDAFKM